MKLMVLPARFIWASLLTFGVIALQRLFMFEAWVWGTLVEMLLTTALCLLYRAELAFI